jgi:GH24 family phage-related lysozyme (muramidase)
MKNKLHISLIILALSLFFVKCGSIPQVDKPSAKSASESIITPGTQPAPGTPKAPGQPVNPFYIGNGGNGISIAILAPKATGLTENQGYIPLLVQGEFVSNFSGYSALSVMDRENLDNIYGELLSGYYGDSDEAGLDLGHLTSTDYLMNGSITKTAIGYALQMQITKTADKMTAASYSGTCTFTELDNLTGIRQASLDLLQKMGIELTDRTKTELAGAAAANHVNAQTALAQGITAQQGGTVVEALSYYYQAATFDSSLLEAASRAGVISAAISSGNIGENVRNDIQRRNEWQKIITEAEDYFSKHLPWEIVYDPTLIQGNIDYTNETVALSFNLEVKPTDGFRTVNTILTGLAATGKATEWNMKFWPLSSTVFVDRITSRDPDWGPVRSGDDMYRRNIHKKVSIVTQLINATGKVIAATECDIFCPLKFRNFQANANVFERGVQVREIYTWDSYVVAETGYPPYYQIGAGKFSSGIVFKNVNANDITENMTVKIISVNGITTELLAKNDYIKISTGRLQPR